MTDAQKAIIALLADGNPRPVTAIADLIGRSQSYTWELLDRLVRGGQLQSRMQQPGRPPSQQNKRMYEKV